ncbi:hypothetical protein QYF36_014474 [Acer negundo]|nr:hypothetical protein QYF36_014474 [Acer negundo]
MYSLSLSMSICSSIILLFLLSPYSESKSNYGVNQTAYEFRSNPTLPSLTNITYEFCQPTTCGRKGPVIRFPFRLKTQPVFCGLEGFELSCSNNNTLLHLPYISSSTSDFYVQEISYLHSNIAITDPNETTCPVKTLFSLNFTSLKSPFFKISYGDWPIATLNCTEKIEQSSSELEEVGPIDCISDDKNFVYVIRGDAYIENCSIQSRSKRIPHLKNTVTNFLETRRMEMEWEALGGCHRCEKSGNFCGFNFTNNSTICVGNKDPLPISVIIGTSIGGTIFFTLVILLIYKSIKSDKEKEVQQRVEKFLEDYKTHNPTRDVQARKLQQIQCPTSSCGDIKNISNPFHLKGDPARCGDPRFELSCESNKTILEIHSGKYYVKRISYDDRIITVVDVKLADGSCGLPQQSLSYYNMYNYNDYRYNILYEYDHFTYANFVRCSSKILDPTYRKLPCLNIGNQSYVYVIYPGIFMVSDLLESCSFISMVPVNASVGDNPSNETIQMLLQSGFDLKWSVGCKDCRPADPYKHCDLDQDKCTNYGSIDDLQMPPKPCFSSSSSSKQSSIREIQSDSSTELLESESIEECSNADTYDV